MKIWITGIKGLMGQTVEHLCSQQSIACISTGREVDISSLSAITDFFHSHNDITHIINCAAFTRVDDGEKLHDEAFAANVIGPENLGKLASCHGLKVIHLSTDYVFDSEEALPQAEQAVCAPTSIYAKTKREGELRLLEQFPKACIVRTSWVFGNGGKNFISSLWDKLHQERAIIAAHDQVNRLTSAADLATTLLSLLEEQGMFHFANHGIASRYDIACYMQTYLQKKGRSLACTQITPVPFATFAAAAPRPRYSVLDTQKIEKVMGLSPRHWQDALEEYMNDRL